MPAEHAQQRLRPSTGCRPRTAHHRSMSPRMKYRLARIGDDVGHVDAAQHPRHDGDVVEAGAADLHPERAEVALADDVVAHLAERVLGRHPGLALGHLDDARHLGHDRAGRERVEQLVDDLRGLAGLLQAHPAAGEAVAVGVGPDLEVDLVVGQRQALVAAQVPVDAAGAQVGARTGRTAGRPRAGITPMPRVRAWKISLPISRSSISSQKLRSFFITERVSSIQPLGRSSLRPPMRSKLGWKRPPVAASIRLRTCSRSRNA